jgi:hypothetical protein
MSARVDLDAQAPLAPQSVPAEALLDARALAFDPDDRYQGPTLPADHPRWMRDTLSVSQRARALLAKIKPAVVQVIAYWEHRVRHITIGGRTLSVDASGSYRFD